MTDEQQKSLTDPQFKVYAEFIFKEGLTRAGVDYQEVVRETDRRRRIVKNVLPNSWTKEERSQLMGTETAVELSKIMGRSSIAINNMRYKLRQKYKQK